MRLLGLDVGDKRVGIALSDESATLASGLDTLERVGPRKDLKAIAALVRQHGVSDVVVGLPRNLDGSLGPQAQKVLQFMDELRPVVKVPVVSWDERFTSAMATQTLIEAGVSRRGRKGVVDKVAATLILQSYLDYLKVVDPEAREPTA
jgi:putative Holliday junction resolvase